MKPFPLLCYIPVSWHGMTPVDQDSGQIGVSLQDEAGNVYRFVLSAESMELLAGTADDHLAAHATRSQSLSDAGTPVVAGFLPPEAGNK